MPSMKPPDPPPFDAKAHEKALYDNVRKGGYRQGDGYQALEYQDAQGQPISYVAFQQWLRKTGYDVTKANAVYLDDVARTANESKVDIAKLEARVKRLEDAPVARPFP